MSSAESPNPTFSLPLTGPAEQELNYNAIFSQFDHQIQATALGDGSVRLKIGNSNWGNFDSNVSNFVNALGTVFLEANASEGYEFVRWDNLPSPDDLYDDNYSLNDTNSSVYFSPSSDHNISATFELIHYDGTEVNLADYSHGSAAILDPEQGGGFKHFGIYDLNATPDPGYVFVNWAGDGNESQLLSDPTEPINQLKVEGPITLTPVFAIRQYNISVTTNGQGTVSGEGNYTFDSNNSSLISAQEATGWYFDQWLGDTSYLSSTTSQYPAFSLPISGPRNQSLSYTANFNQFSHNVYVSIEEGNGSISLKIGNDQWSTSSSPLSSEFFSLSKVFLEANASEGYEFVRWDNLPSPDDLYDDNYSLNDTNSSVYFSPSSDHNISATFELIHYDGTEVNLADYSHGSAAILDPEQGGGFKHFGIYDLNATPDPGYVFVNWAGDGNESQLLSDPTEPINQLKVEGPITLTPVFAIRQYNISVTTNGQGTVSGEGNYTFDSNNSSLISAQEATGWYFDQWLGDTSYLSSTTSQYPAFSLPISGPRNQSLSYTANFNQFSHNVYVSIEEGNGSISLKIGNDQWSTSSSPLFRVFLPFQSIPGSQCLGRV